MLDYLRTTFEELVWFLTFSLRRSGRWIYGKEKAAFLTTICTLILAVFAVIQACVSQHALNLSHRPWIGVTLIQNLEEWPKPVDDRITFSLSLRLKNVGKSPGIILDAAAAAFPGTEDWRWAQKKTCKEARARLRTKHLDNFAVLPDGEWPHHVKALLQTSLSQLRKSGEKVFVFVVGCVLYRSTFDGAERVTAFYAVASEEYENNPKHAERREANSISINHLADPPKGSRIDIKELSIAGEPPQ